MEAGIARERTQAARSKDTTDEIISLISERAEHGHFSLYMETHVTKKLVDNLKNLGYTVNVHYSSVPYQSDYLNINWG